MKKAEVLFVLFACSLTVCSQDPAEKPKVTTTRNMALEVSAGYSVALGTFRSSDQQNKKSGYATNGWQLQITYDWMGKKDFGMAIQYTFQRNAMRNAVNEVFPKGIPDSVGSGSWSNHYVMIGPVFMKTIRRIYLDARVLGGVVVSSSSLFTTPSPLDTTGVRKDVNIGTGFAFQVSAGVGYAFSSHVALKFNLNFLCGWPGKSKQYSSQLLGYKEYIDPETNLPYYEPIYTAAVTYDMNKVVTTLNPSLGLVYRF